MTFHIVLPRPLSVAEASAAETVGDRPRVGVAMLARQLDAELHWPRDDETPVWSDSLRSRISGPPRMWAMGRRLANGLGPQDVVFCSSESGGVQLAGSCGSPRTRPKICTFVHNLDRPRGRAALKLFGLPKRMDLVLACSQTQVDFLRTCFPDSPSQVQFVWDHTDNRFFTPGPATPGKPRPTIVSVGLEKRDYRTLATATSDLDLDVRISGFSEDAAVVASTFPPELPVNMTRRFYPWTELVQLYRDADVVVVSVHENHYAAGVQNLMEAMACGRPVVATASTGLKKYLDERCVVSVPPGDPLAMRQAIEALLADRERAEAMGRRGHEIATERHGIDRYVADIAGHLRALAAEPRPSPAPH